MGQSKSQSLKKKKICFAKGGTTSYLGFKIGCHYRPKFELRLKAGESAKIDRVKYEELILIYGYLLGLCTDSPWIKKK